MLRQRVIRSKIILLFFIAAICVSFCSCRDKDQPSASHQMAPIRKILTIAVVPEENVFALKKKYIPTMKYLSDKLNMHVQIKVLDSYGTIYNELTQGKVEGAILGSAAVVLCYDRVKIDFVARPEYLDSSSFYRTIIFTRKDSSVTGNIDTWRGKQLALAHELTAASFFVKFYLRKHGRDSAHFFKNIHYAGSHDAAAVAVFEGNADIGGGKESIIVKYLAKHPQVRDRYVVLAISEAVPENALVLRADLDADLKEKLKSALFEMSGDEAGSAGLIALGAKRFVETRLDEYAGVYRMFKDLDIDPASCQLSGTQ